MVVAMNSKNTLFIKNNYNLNHKLFILVRSWVKFNNSFMKNEHMDHF